MILIISERALAGMAPWIDHRPVNGGVAGSVPGEGMCLGRRPGQAPSWGHVRGNRTLMFLSLSSSFPPSLPLFLKINL